ADHPPRGHVQHAVQEQLALVGDDLGGVAIPLAVDLRGGEPAPDQVRGPPPACARAGAAAAPLAAGDQPLLGHDLRDRVLADPPPGLVQVGGDPRGAVAATVRGEQPRDLSRELGAPRPPPGGVPGATLVEPCRADTQRPARGGMRNLVLGPLDGDEPGHRYRPIASLTQRATDRLRTSRCIRSSTFSRRSRSSSTRSLSLNAALPSSRLRRSRAHQLPSVPSLMPNSRATCAIGLPVSSTSRTAPARKS